MLSTSQITQVEKCGKESCWCVYKMLSDKQGRPWSGATILQHMDLVYRPVCLNTYNNYCNAFKIHFFYSMDTFL